MTKAKTDVVPWEEMMANEAKDVAKTERPSVARISLQSGVMTYQDAAIPDNILDCIVAAAIHEQVYYDKPFQQGIVNPPACFALGAVGSNLSAHETVGERDYGPECVSCEMNAWGSSTTGSGKGKACGERRKLAILPLFDNPEEYKNAEIAVMSLPVMSVRNWRTYVNQLSAQYQRPAWGMITRIKVVPDAKSQFKVLFEAGVPLAEEFMGAVHNRVEMCVNTLMVPYDMTPTEERETSESDKY